MSLRDQIKTKLVESMKAKEPVRVSTLRLVQAAIKDRDIAARTRDVGEGCAEEQILQILAKLLKQREESARIYEEAGRADLAEREREESAIIAEFMPRQMSDEEIQAAARAVVEELDAAGLKDMGKCMAALKAKYGGAMDFGKAGAAVKAILS
ncbi:MAG: GatB/YqeY domain-containing protein [Robiginitomaculum sp.]|nr:GatB/YqeY domain-containing protein [Robiginitomaculum sp.]MDQ7077856.1 GatB/YqeY domain-containing protein [Robiginitomaculum sp.]